MLALLRVPLAARYPEPADLQAVLVLLVTQVLASALLHPYLLRDRASAVAVAATAWPFLVLAGGMSGARAPGVALAGCYVTGWLVAWWALNASWRSRGGHFGVALASLSTAGTLILFYLHIEGSPHDAGTAAEKWAAASPPLAALRQLSGTPHVRDWMVPALIAVVGVGTRILARRSSQVIHRL